MIAMVFSFDRQPHRVHAVRDAYRMSEVLPTPWDAGMPADDRCVAWNGHSAFLVPQGMDIPGYTRNSMTELLEGGAVSEILLTLSALLHRYRMAEAEPDPAAELAVILVPDATPSEQDSDIAAAALMAGFRRCTVLRSTHALRATFPDLPRARELLALHASRGEAHATRLASDARGIGKPLDHVLSGTAVGVRLQTHVALVFGRSKSERFMREAAQGLEQVWLQPGAGSVMVWSEHDRAPLRISLDRCERDKFDLDLLAALEDTLELESGPKKAVSTVYCTGPLAEGTRRLVGLLFPNAEIECDVDSRKLVRAAAVEGSARQDQWRGSTLVVRTEGARALGGNASDQKLLTKLGRGVPEFAESRFPFQQLTSKTLLVETAGKPAVTLGELAVRRIDERRGWAYFAVRILNDDTRIFSCEVELGRKGMVQMMILDRDSGQVRRIDGDRIRRVRAS